MEQGQAVYVADTATTCSMFRLAANLVNYRERSGWVKGIVGDKAPVPLLGYGDVTVVLQAEDGGVPVTVLNAAHVPEAPYNVLSLSSLAEEGHTYSGMKGGLTLTTEAGGEVWFPRTGKLLTQRGYQIKPTLHTACAALIVPGDAKAANPTDLNEYHLAHGHAHETLLRITAEQQGVQLTDGPLLPCLGCSMSKGHVKPVQKSTSTSALLPLADDDEGGEGESRADASRQGWGGEIDSESESDLDVMEARGPGQATPFVGEEAPTAPGNGIPGDGGSVPPSSPSGRGDFGGGSDSPTDSSSSSSSSSSSPSSSSSDVGGAGGLGGEESDDPGGDGGSDGDPGDSENLEELKYDPADDRYPRGLEGKKLLWGASNAGPLRHGLESGRTRKQTREMQGAGEMPGPGETPDPEEALLATILETGGTGIVEDYICNSLVKEQWDEEQTRRMEEMYRREMQEVSGPEQQAFGAEVDASGSSQPLPDPQLSMTSPIGQKPSDVEAVPMTYKDVMCSKYKVFWEAAMKKEIDGHDKTGTFTKVKELPEGRKAIGSKWVFSWKTNEKGLIVDFKARMVARGFSQIPGIDFHHSSSACPSAASIKTVIAVATEKGKKLAHWDVKQAYIHAKLKEEIYLRFPEGCGSMSGKVVKVERALYGLKQGGREWGFEAADALIENGYEQCRVDPCVFRKVVDGEVVGLIVIYVDDILVAADEGEREELFASLNKKFPVKDLGECTWYDGCAIAMDVENGITKLSQTAYIESMLKRFDVTTTAFTPAATDADLGPKRDDEPAVDKPVREAIGCLMWTKLTRPDIALPLNKLQKIAHSPTGRIWNALVRIMSYLNFTKDFGITYVRGSGLDLSVFVDASYADNEVDRRSTTGLAGVKEALFVRGVLSFIALETSGAKARSKHIDVRFHFIRELFKSGKITAEYVPTGEQHADMLTKVLGREKLEYHRKALMNQPM
ncbi:unnamed protein product [Ectocarpus sp. CCAP 1310/34]|nr:unnamed protein product [Ectocarpus sp. CCAP 1310/34]